VPELVHPAVDVVEVRERLRRQPPHRILPTGHAVDHHAHPLLVVNLEYRVGSGRGDAAARRRLRPWKDRWRIVGSPPHGSRCDWAGGRITGLQWRCRLSVCSPPLCLQGFRQMLRCGGGPRWRPCGRRRGTWPCGRPTRRDHRRDGRSAQAPTDGQGRRVGGSHGASQEAATRASNSARTSSSSLSTRSTKTSASSTVGCVPVALIDLTSSTNARR